MAITSITHSIRGKSSRIEAIRTRGLDQPQRQQLLVDVITEDGVVGTGEAWWGLSSAGQVVSDQAATQGFNHVTHAPYATIQSAIEGILAPRCIGRHAGDIEGLWSDMSDFAARYGDGGIITMALSGIDLALWDGLGKRLGVPVNQLIGGRAHERRPAAHCPSL